jgi:hypothetical protein
MAKKKLENRRKSLTERQSSLRKSCDKYQIEDYYRDYGEGDVKTQRELSLLYFISTHTSTTSVSEQNLSRIGISKLVVDSSLGAKRYVHSI